MTCVRFHRIGVAFVVMVCVARTAIGHPAEQRSGPTTPSTSPTATTRQVRVSPLTIVSLNAHVRFTTLIVLPEKEQILDALCGDKELWQVSASANFAWLKPGKPGASTNVNLLTATGNVYSFVATDISQQSDATADLKVFVEPDEQMLPTQAAPKYVPFSEVAVHQQRAATAVAEAQEKVDRALADYPTTLRFAYRFERNRGPFWLEAIWHDGTRTYVRTRATELPALYEVRDGKPSLIQFQVRGDAGSHTYIVPKVLDAAYFRVGDKRSEFRREQ